MLNLLCAKLTSQFYKSKKKTLNSIYLLKANFSYKNLLKLLAVRAGTVKAVISQLLSVCEILGKSIEGRDDLVAVSETWFFISTNCYGIMECQLFENTACRHHLIRAHPLITKAGAWAFGVQPAEGGLSCWRTAKARMA